MMDLNISDTLATNGCGCGCGGHDAGPSTPGEATSAGAPVGSVAHTEGHACACGGHAQADAACHCGADCTCGCQDGKACTCSSAASDADAAAHGTPQGGGVVTATYTVSGMTCEHCVNAVTEEVSAIPGVQGVDVDLATGKLTVRSDAPVDFDRIVEACLEAGDYTVE